MFPPQRYAGVLGLNLGSQEEALFGWILGGSWAKERSFEGTRILCDLKRVNAHTKVWGTHGKMAADTERMQMPRSPVTASKAQSQERRGKPLLTLTT